MEQSLDLPILIAVGAFNSRWRFLTNRYEIVPSVMFIKTITYISKNTVKGGGFVTFKVTFPYLHLFVPPPLGQEKAAWWFLSC